MAVADVEPGALLHGRYRLGAPIASGAMGAVHRAHDERTGADVALKRLLDRRHQRRFTIEARLLARLSHPRIVDVLDHFEEQSGNYLVMRLVRGVDLARHLRTHGTPGVPLAQAVAFVRQACEALEYVHGEQVVHRDVKPQNLIVDEAGDVTLVDFGIARELGPDSGTAGIGTPSFMAPEVLAGDRASARSDVYGAAATLWTLLTGRPPRYGMRLDLAEHVPDAPPGLARALAAGLEMLPEQRTGSAAAFAEALGAPLPAPAGVGLALSVATGVRARPVLEAIARTAAGVFEAAATSIALLEPGSGDLHYKVAWGAGAPDILGLRIPAGTGIAGAVARDAEGAAVPDCRSDPRWASAVASMTGYVPQTMVVVPMARAGEVIGVLSVLDRRDGTPYGPADIPRAALFAELAMTALQAADPGDGTLATLTAP